MRRTVLQSCAKKLKLIRHSTDLIYLPLLSMQPGFSDTSQRPLATSKNLSELKQRTNRNLEFSQWTNNKQRGMFRNLVDISSVNIISPIYLGWSRRWIFEYVSRKNPRKCFQLRVIKRNYDVSKCTQKFDITMSR
jgi:hypothetical protein